MNPEAHVRGIALLDALESGEVRVAERSDDGDWSVNEWIREEILELFRSSSVVEFGTDLWRFVDKDVFPPRAFTAGDGVRLVPGGSAVRRGAFLGRDTVLMPPCYVNVGAYVGRGSMIDSHALVGSCAQIGERVHVSAAAQLGGVLEPVGSRPVIIEDDVLIGGQCGVYEGVIVRRGAVLAPGVMLTRSTPVFDLVHDCELRSAGERPLEIPENAVVVPGSRPASGRFAQERGLSAGCALIVKIRDAGTNRAVALERALRGDASDPKR